MKYVTGLVLVPLFKIKTDAKMSAVTDLTQQCSIVRRHKKSEWNSDWLSQEVTVYVDSGGTYRHTGKMNKHSEDFWAIKKMYYIIHYIILY